MALRNIVKSNDDLLRKKSKEITVFDDKLKELAADLIDTVKFKNGVGLAAPQIGVLKRIVTVDKGERDFIILVNPVILKESTETCVLDEGCLSVENKIGPVKRPKRIIVKAQDLEGNTFTFKASKMFARICMHEFDHLDGILFIDKLEPEKNKEI